MSKGARVMFILAVNVVDAAARCVCSEVPLPKLKPGAKKYNPTVYKNACETWASSFTSDEDVPDIFIPGIVDWMLIAANGDRLEIPFSEKDTSLNFVLIMLNGQIDKESPCPIVSMLKTKTVVQCALYEKAGEEDDSDDEDLFFEEEDEEEEDSDIDWGDDDLPPFPPPAIRAKKLRKKKPK
jgi:hypothetical protein